MNFYAPLNKELINRIIAFDGGPWVSANGFLIREDYKGEISHYRIEIRRQKEGSGLWAVTNGYDSCFSKKEDDFIYEMMPSNRTEEFIMDTRFRTGDEAFNVLMEWKNRRRQELEEKGWKYWE